MNVLIFTLIVLAWIFLGFISTIGLIFTAWFAQDRYITDLTMSDLLYDLDDMYPLSAFGPILTAILIMYLLTIILMGIFNKIYTAVKKLIKINPDTVILKKHDL